LRITFELLPEADVIPFHSRDMVNCFFLQNKDNSFTIPEKLAMLED